MVRLDHILAATSAVGGRVLGQVRAAEFDAFAFDSRKIVPGELFLAVRTAKADGHRFIAEALQRGATGLICECEVDDSLLEKYGATCVVVNDARAALEAWGAYILAKYRPAVIAITGSVGKTTTQQAIRAVLAQGYEANPAVFANDNYNDLFGLPIALSRLLPSHQQAILELASDSFGELGRLAAMISPQIGVVTNAAPVHLQYLGTLENLAGEYSALVAALPSEGYAILNYDDPRVRAMREHARAHVMFYSAEDPAADFFAERLHSGEGAVSFVLHCPNGHRELTVPLPGRHHAYTALAAAAVGLLSGFTLDEIAAALANLRPLPGRLNPLTGINGTRLLDDSFSASPASMRAALDALADTNGEIKSGRRIAVIGDMLGLGDYEVTALEETGQQAAGVVDFLITRGDKAALVARAARGAGMAAEGVVATYRNEDAVTILARTVQPGDTVLVKGSEEARMEKIVEGLLADPASAPDCLVRQDAGWKQLVALHRERPTWLEIDLGAVAHNVRRVKEILGPGVEVLAVLKADAYGHGAARAAQTALLHGATMLGTACLSEAVALRERGIAAPILVLGYTPPWQARDLLRYDLSAALYSLDLAKQLSRAAALQGRQAARVHLKVDTGMGRLGVAPEEVLPLVEQVLALPDVEIEGIFTHLATADAADQSYAQDQLGRFEGVLQQLASRGVHPRYTHAANSAALLTIPRARYNLVRLGIALYGLNPSAAVRCPDDFRCALSFKTQIAQIKQLPAGSCVSYGCTFRTDRPSVIAVIPAGYGDGFRRGPRNGGSVLVRGRRAQIVGVVCMDMCMIDITDIPGVSQGDEVVIVGEQGGDRITVDELAESFGTINYEVIAQILPRVPREVS